MKIFTRKRGQALLTVSQLLVVLNISDDEEFYHMF